MRIPEQLKKLPGNLATWAGDVPESLAELKDDLGEIFDYRGPNMRVPTPEQLLPDMVLNDFGANTAWEFSVNERRNIRDQVSVLPVNSDAYNAGMKRSWLDFFDNPTIQAGILEMNKEGTQSRAVVYGPYSLYYPSALWPFTTEEGKRYTVMDLAEEPIESDWFGTKPWIEWATDVKYDKVGALPGFRKWGDKALGMTALAPVVGAGIVAFITWPFWTKFIGDQSKEFINAVKRFPAKVLYYSEEVDLLW